MLPNRLIIFFYVFYLALGSLSCSKSKTPISPQPSPPEIAWASQPITVAVPENGGVWYPRLLQLDDGSLLCAFDTNENASSTFISLAKSTDAGMTWHRLDAIYSSSFNSANAHLVQCADGTILCAFREVVSNTSYNIKLSASSDGGSSWHVVSAIDHNSRGLWEPFLLPLADSTVIAFYSTEAFAPQYSQVIAQRVSPDLGRTWGQVTITSKNSLTRDGMPSVVKMANGDWLCFFEATDEENPFVIKTVRSSDEGKTWKNRRLLYRPDKPNKLAGAPWSILLWDQRLLCSFQTDEDRSDGLGSVDMKVVMSTDSGKTWGNKSTVYSGPFGVWWNSLVQLADGSVIAATSTNDSERMAIRLIVGTIK